FTRAVNLTVLSANPLQSLRDSFPSGDAFAVHALLVHAPFMGFLNSMVLDQQVMPLSKKQR
ncbi:MAG: hypothetical protein IJF08_02425, partial [Clostridia bacterium]|nr:hypothetical protein [Clostridia bacterium]